MKLGTSGRAPPDVQVSDSDKPKPEPPRNSTVILGSRLVSSNGTSIASGICKCLTLISMIPRNSPPGYRFQGNTADSHHSHSFSPSSCPSPAQSAVSAEGSESRAARSRESSPNQSDNDQNNPRRRYPCLILGCSRRFTSQYTLKVHMEAHKPKPRVSFPCTLGCSEKFSRQHDRLRHEVAKHGKVCEFSCEDCGRFFSTKKTLGNHKCPVAQGTRWVNT